MNFFFPCRYWSLMIHHIFHSAATWSYATDSYVNKFLRQPPMARRQSLKYSFHFSPSFAATALAVKSRALSFLQPTGFCWPILFFPLQCGRHFWDKQSAEMSPDSMESKRAVCRQAGGTVALSSAIRQNFMSYYGVTTMYKTSFKNIILKWWAMRHFILML